MTRGRVGKGIAQTLDSGGEQAVVGAMRSIDRVNKKGERKLGQQIEIRKDNISNCLSTVNKDNYVVKSAQIRRLTPLECERLQGFPDNWTKFGQELGKISDSQRYKMCGNAVTVDVVTAVANKIKSIL